MKKASGALKAPLSQNTTTIFPHPLSESVPGEMSTEEFDALCISVKAHGLRHPIVMFEDKILDGRARHRACVKTETKPTFEQFKGTPAEALEFVIDNNLHRRQLNSMQKALVAARIHMKTAHLPTTDKTRVSQGDAAQAVGVGIATVALAVKLLDSKNTPLIKRCERGEATRAEIDEILFDRAETLRQRASTLGAGGAPGGSLDDDELFGDPGDDTTPRERKAGGSDNVIPIDRNGAGQPTTRMSKPGTRNTETPASRCVQHYKGLSELERKDFCVMAWSWLKPALVSAGKIPAGMADDTGAAAPLTGKAAKAAAAAIAKATATAKAAAQAKGKPAAPAKAKLKATRPAAKRKAA